MRKLRFFYFYLLKLLLRYKIRALVLCLAAVGAAFLVFNFKDDFRQAAFSEGLVGTFTEDDLPPVVTQLLSRGLTSTDASGSAIPDLAKEWSSNDESTEFIFKLKDNLTWSDGSRLRSSDLNLGFADARVETPDDSTIVFKLADSYSPFPTLLSKPVLKKGSNTGVGPFFILKASKDIVFLKRIVLRSKDKQLPELTIRFYPNEKIAKNALKIGEVKSLFGISDPEDLKLDKPFGLLSQPNYNRLVTVFYNTQDPVLADENLRLALSFAMPSVSGEEEAKTPLSTYSWAFNPNVKDYLDNQAQAKDALKKVQNLSDTQITLTSTNSLKDIGEKIVDSWNKMGVKSVLRVESGIPQNFQALLIAQKIPSDPDQYSLWHKLGSANISKYSNQRIDKDLEDGRKLKNFEQRKAKYQDFQKVLLDHAPASFLYFPKYNILYLKKLKPQLDQILQIQKNAL